MPPPIFAGVSIYVDGLTDPPNLVLRDLICKHGGDYQYYLVSTVTHIVTVNLPDAKVKLLKYVCSPTAWSARIGLC